MNKLSMSLAILGAIAALGVSPVFGQGVFPFDEFGNGAFGPGVLQADPTGGYLGGPVMVYPLPFAGTPGDVLMHDGGLAGLALDVLRFTGNGQLIFYSDNIDGFDAPADTGGPPNPLLPNQANIVEQGVEGGFQDAFYAPIPGQPGFDPTLPPGATYHFISDYAVPEPTSLSIVAIGAIAGSLFVRRRRN
jgi:PEP-CTERM motif